jgi:hypothetical protein
VDNQSDIYMKEYAKGIATQFTSILLAAAGAAAIAFIQSLLAASGDCSIPQVVPQDVGLMGALLKGSHSAVLGIKKIT